MPKFLKKEYVKHCWQKTSVKWTVLILVFLFVSYSAIGFWGVPVLFKYMAQHVVAEKFHRDLTFSKVTFNPFTWRAELDNMQLSEPNSSQSFATFDSLTVDLSGQSLLAIAPVIEEIRLVNPHVRLIRTDSHHYNIDDFLAFIMTPKEEDSSARFAINNIQIDKAVIEFEDIPQKKHHVVDELNISIPFISSIPSQVEIFVDLAVSGKFNGEKIVLTGKARPFSKEQDGMATIQLDNIDLPSYIGYVPFQPGFVLKDGTLSLNLDIGFARPENGMSKFTIGGQVVLDSLEMDGLDGHELIQLPHMEIDLARSDVLSGDIRIDRISLDAPKGYLDRHLMGDWNISR